MDSVNPKRKKDSTRACRIIRSERKEAVSETDNSGVYVMKCQGRYKIGVSGCVSKRLEKLNTASPFEVELVAVFPTSIPYPLEKHLHHNFSMQNVKGEWFALDPQDLERLRQIAYAFPEQLSLGFQTDGCAGMEPESRSEPGAEPDNEGREAFWICPICNFLTRRPGVCDWCKEEVMGVIAHHTVQAPHSVERRYV